MPAKQLTMSAADWFILIGLSMLWGGSFFFNEITLRDFSPLTVVWLRVSIAALCLWTIVLYQGTPIPKERRFWLVLLLLGLSNNALPFTLIVWGQQHIGSGLASILNATMPLFTVLVAGMLLSDERLQRHKLTGVMLGILGVTVIIGPQHIVSLGDNVIAQLAVLGAALSYACSTVLVRRLKITGATPILTAAAQVTMASVWLLPICMLNENYLEFETASLTSWGAIIALGMFCTALAYIGYFKVLSSAGATNISLVTFLVPVSAIFLGWVFLDETLNSAHYTGMLCIGLGLATIDGRPATYLRARLRGK